MEDSHTTYSTISFIWWLVRRSSALKILISFDGIVEIPILV